jgi:CubicO group peptidase (beta-lactamase class C family)
MKLTTSILSLLVLITTSSFATEFNNKVDLLFSGIDRENAPGCNVGVIKDGAFIHKAGYGLANIELAVPLSGDNVHRIGSVSKQFTALAVLLLAEEGKIDLQNDIRTYLSELKNYGAKVTVNSMLGHFSGMADYDYIADDNGATIEGGANLLSVAGGPFRLGNEDYLSIPEFYEVVKKVSLRNPPDTKWQYSNLAYFLLSMLVEEVSGESLRHYADKRIFKPLGMSNTFFSDEPNEIVQNRASGYKPKKEGGYQADMTNLFWVGDGGLHTTVGDLLKWDQNFYAPKVGKNPAALMTLFTKPNSQFDAFGGLYANGQVIHDIDGKKDFSHGGGWLGVSTFYARSPDDKFSTIILCNDVSQNPGKYAKQIRKLYFGTE